MSYQFPVQLRDRVEALVPVFDELGQMGINAGRSRARLLFWKGAMSQPARNGSVADPYLVSDGGLPEALLAEGYHVLVSSQALLSFCLPQHTALWKRMQGLFRVRWFQRGGPDGCDLTTPTSGKMTGQDPLQGRAKIFDQMEPIGTLDRLGSTCSCRRSIIPSTISTHQFQFPVGCHPRGSRFHVSVGQKIDSLVALQVDKDRPTSTTPSE
jgi:hypothetical protein